MPILDLFAGFPRIYWRGWRVAVSFLLTLAASGYVVASAGAVDTQLSTYCAADAAVQTRPKPEQMTPSAAATVVVGLNQPCWVRVNAPSVEPAQSAPTALALSESLALDIQAFDPQGKLLAHVAPGLQPQHALNAGRLVLLEHTITDKAPVWLYLTLEPLATENRRIETELQWTSPYAALPPILLGMSTSLLAAGGLAFVIFLSCALAFALRRPLFALGGVASLINVQYLLGDSGSYRVLNLPASIFTYQSPLLLACVGMLLLFVTEFCNFRQHCKKTAIALLAMTGFFFGAMLWLLVFPEAFIAFDVYEWLRLPAYLLMLYGFAQGLRVKHVPSIMCLAALLPDYVYLAFYTVPHLEWVMGRTIGVKLPEFAQQGSVFELVVILWLPFMLCMALTHRVLTVERERTKAALTDSLTGLPNRAGIQLALGKRTGEFTTVVLDLNRFKSIDLALGRNLGDQVLCSFAERLQHLPQAIVARLHSDRFAVILRGQLQADALVSQVDALLETPLHIEGQVVDLSATLGFFSGTNSTDLEQHLRKAELALHHARLEQSRSQLYDPSMEQPGRNDLSLLTDLHQAIVKQELRLFLQPKVRLADGSVTAAEGLVRWQHPQRGMVPPSEFVTFAEQIGRIGLITQWVLQEAMKIVAQQRKNGTPLQISVNISAIDLADDSFVDQIMQLAASTGAEPCDIKLEITESAAMAKPAHAMAAMQRLHELGFKWSLDDFGTGYSSLSYLQKMPLSELKVDRAFVCNVTPDSDAAKLLGSVIALGHQFGLSVVAEGAETKAEWELLRTLGADLVQGWYAAKAMPLQDFLQWRQEHPNFGV